MKKQEVKELKELVNESKELYSFYKNGLSTRIKKSIEIIMLKVGGEVMLNVNHNGVTYGSLYVKKDTFGNERVFINCSFDNGISDEFYFDSIYEINALIEIWELFIALIVNRKDIEQ